MIVFFPAFRLINDHELKFVMCIYLNNLTHVRIESCGKRGEVKVRVYIE